MSVPSVFPFPAWTVSTLTQTAGTAITRLVPPYPGSAQRPSTPYSVNANGLASWTGASTAWTHVSQILYTTSTTQHNVYVMRPLNWTYLTAAVAKNTTVFNVAADPGVYSTNYKYPTAGGVPPCQAADNAIAANDYVAFQYVDGTWQLDTVASVSSLAITLTTGTANRTGATVAANSPFFFFGIQTDVDPADGVAHWHTTTTASTNRAALIADYFSGGIQSWHPGDPMVIYVDNLTAAGALDLASGFYQKH